MVIVSLLDMMSVKAKHVSLLISTDSENMLTVKEI